jgi:hypothetical protein
LTFLGNHLKGRPTEVAIERSLIVQYVKDLFRHQDFPEEISVALQDSAMVNKGDIVWLSTDCEHPYDFIALPCIASLIVNLPTKSEFMKKFDVQRLEEVTAEQEADFWESFEFQFAEVADGVKLIWE